LTSEGGGGAHGGGKEVGVNGGCLSAFAWTTFAFALLFAALAAVALTLPRRAVGEEGDEVEVEPPLPPPQQQQPLPVQKEAQQQQQQQHPRHEQEVLNGVCLNPVLNSDPPSGRV